MNEGKNYNEAEHAGFAAELFDKINKWMLVRLEALSSRNLKNRQNFSRARPRSLAREKLKDLFYSFPIFFKLPFKNNPLFLASFFSRFLPSKTRSQAYEPRFYEITEDFLIARKSRAKWVRWCIGFWFVCKTLTMILDCFVIAASANLKRILLRLVPESLRKLLSN